LSRKFERRDSGIRDWLQFDFGWRK